MLATPAASPTTAPLPTESVAATTTPPPAEQSSPRPAASQTPAGEAIVLSATGGNLNLRRGPGQAYDVLGFLLNGQASPASGRNDPTCWVYLAVPNTPGASGWVSVDSRYVSLAPGAGAVQPLPVLGVDPPKRAYLRNCTFHPMQVDPAPFVLEPQTHAPDNRKQVHPGTYTTLDPSVAEAVARTIPLQEGQTQDITTDGPNNTYACP